jgi:hypothetical protein
MNALSTALAAGLAVTTCIFLFYLLYLVKKLKKAFYIPWKDAIIIFHAYNQFGDIGKTRVFINSHQVRGSSRIIVPGLLALTFADTAEMEPETIIINEDVEMRFTLSDIVFTKKDIIRVR